MENHERIIYMDNGAAERPSRKAKEKLDKLIENAWANANSGHKLGRETEFELEDAKKTIAGCLNCEPEEVHFTSTSCEAITWAMYSMDKCRKHIEKSPFLHDCGYKYRTKSHCADKIHPESVGIAHILANNETGEIYPIPKRLYKEDLIFTDATAAVGHIHVDFKELGVDYLCGDGIKFGGIGGAAFLLAKKGVPLHSIIYGGKDRGGTPATVLCGAMAEALKHKCANMERSMKKTVEMRDYLIEKILGEVKNAHLNGPWEKGSVKERLPGNVNISFEGIEGDSMNLFLSHWGLMVSSKSACSTGNGEPSRVLLASGVSEELAKGALRLTVNESNTMEECYEAVKIIKNAVVWLRSF